MTADLNFQFSFFFFLWVSILIVPCSGWWLTSIFFRKMKDQTCNFFIRDICQFLLNYVRFDVVNVNLKPAIMIFDFAT